MRLVYSEEAITDLVRLRQFIAEKDPGAASRIASELIARMEHLCKFPHTGVEVELAPQPGVVRDMVFGNYIVRYAAQMEVIVILRIWHHLENERNAAH
ncbi:type II toxin-antitoxin system RelE/ParE family toxin [Betaproteobacteria bacterium PRO4]|uniref:type II toxin-antitoxin system RelE/ParE family toxin n=1 Tax=Nitrosomonas sp. TaxID=42353 RepID=UPI00256048D6|nr:type II toxin-antitoxin system RelE/ParE family toxin [Nitrosomonas sp.]MBE7528106.1 type II toxin-antitoxin system RelE/ParE family toxin [Burkholderiales bacterium]MDL1866708.1 type II toxin-antitoxin system RelE/ParE family toxin [Betaproteobacteria bacterium PRO4]